MEQNFKGIVIVALIIVALFAGGLYYIFQENQNRKVTLNLVQEYMESKSQVEKESLEMEIRQRIKKRPIALTSRASFESYEVLMDNAYRCNIIADREQVYDPENQTRSYDQIWRDCMDNPEQLQNINSPR